MTDMQLVSQLLEERWGEVRDLEPWSGIASLPLPAPEMHVIYEARVICGTHSKVTLIEFVDLLREQQLHLQNEGLATHEWYQVCYQVYVDLMVLITSKKG